MKPAMITSETLLMNSPKTIFLLIRMLNILLMVDMAGFALPLVSTSIASLGVLSL
jgi:hypothetical protein